MNNLPEYFTTKGLRKEVGRMHTQDKGTNGRTEMCPGCASPLLALGEPANEQSYCAGCGWNHPYRRRRQDRRLTGRVGRMLGAFAVLVGWGG